MPKVNTSETYHPVTKSKKPSIPFEANTIKSPGTPQVSKLRYVCHPFTNTNINEDDKQPSSDDGDNLSSQKSNASNTSNPDADPTAIDLTVDLALEDDTKEKEKKQLCQ